MASIIKRPNHPLPWCVAWLEPGIRQHDFRRTFIALHVEARMHPKLVQDRVGHSDIRLTMDIYGKAAGKMALAQEQEALLDDPASKALPSPA